VKRLSDQTLYEILEVSVEAPPDEIERAYERARALYGPGSIATYTLMSPDEAALLNNRIEEAKVVLLDPDARSRYDERIGVRPRAAPAATPPPAPVQGAATHWPPPQAPVATPVPEAAVTSSTAGPPPAPPVQAQLPIVLQTPIATPPPGTVPEAVTAPPAPAPPAPAAEVLPPAPLPAPPPAEAEPPMPPSPGTAALTISPAPLSPPAAAPPAAPPIPLKHELPAPRDLLVPEGAAWTGEMLRQVREARGMTVPQISERTKVTRHHLENIEGDRFATLPAPVYLRGILMSLARELRLDGQKVARSYLERMAAALAAAPKK